jgi:hypothetical protein
MCWSQSNYVHRPASVTLDQSPTSVYSTPDGACLLLSFLVGSQLVLKAYHWATFGSTDGIAIICPDTFTEPLLVTSMVNRQSVHVMSLDSNNKACYSLALDITKKITDFTFREHGEVGSLKRKSGNTLHNCLIDCHEDVWTRFPVLAAVQRQAILSSHGRCPPKLVFVVDGEEHHQHISPTFLEMKHRFHQKTHKPLSNDLKNMEVLAQGFDQFLHSADWDKSIFCVGEWLVNIICLVCGPVYHPPETPLMSIPRSQSTLLLHGTTYSCHSRMVSHQQSMSVHCLVQKSARLLIPFPWVGMNQSSSHTWPRRSESPASYSISLLKYMSSQ